jgi:ATP-dependent 26S proteasome regulatory subunit
MSATAQSQRVIDWGRTNREYLDVQLQRLRLLLRRKVACLRTRWAHDAAQDFLAWRISEAQADWLLGGEDGRAEAAFCESNSATREMTQSLAEINRRLRERSDQMDAVGAPPALEVLARLFCLNAFERDVLLMALAPEIDSGFEKLFGYVHDDITRRRPTPQLALSLFLTDDGLQDGRESFLPEGPLRRYRLIELERTEAPPGFSGRPFHADERMLNFVLGFNRPDERMRTFLTSLRETPISKSNSVQVERAVSWLRDAQDRLARRSIYCLGPTNAIRLGPIRAICDALGISVSQVNVAALPSDRPQRSETLALIGREAVLLQTALYMDLDEVRGEDRQPLLREVSALDALCTFGSAAPFACERETLFISVSRPDAREQTDLWRQSLSTAGLDVKGPIEGIVEQFDLDEPQIAGAVAAAQEKCSASHAIAIEDLWRVCEHQVAPKVGELASRMAPSYTWEDIVLPPEPFHQLREICGQVAHRAAVYEKWGFGAKLGRGKGIAVLFAGPSGTGKTMAAEVLAGQLKLDLYRIDLAGVVSKYIGETEKNLRAVFDAADRGGVILFFDEADALFGKRSEVKDSHDRYANIEVNYLLQRMEEYRGLAILATNRKSALDNAFVRRLRFIVDFPFPDSAHRALIWEKTVPPQADVHGLDFKYLSRMELSGGNIRNIALAAAFLAASEGAPIGMPHVMRAARREYAKMERLVPESEFGPYAAAVAR